MPTVDDIDRVCEDILWVCSAKQCRKVLLVMEPVAWSAWHGRLTIPAWTKGGPLSAGSARPAKSRYQLWWWHTQCHWNNYPEWDCAARLCKVAPLWDSRYSIYACRSSKMSGKTLGSNGTKCYPWHHMPPCIIPDHHMLSMEPFLVQHIVVWQYQSYDQWLSGKIPGTPLFLMNWTLYSH